MEGKAQRPTIVLLVQHMFPEEYHSLYTIQPPLDLSVGYEKMIDSEGYMDSGYISPALPFSDRNRILCSSASVNLGSKVYFLGGSRRPSDNVQVSRRRARRLACKVQVFDTDHPEEGLQCVARMKTPKVSPCVFVADGMIYALGYPPRRTKNKPTSIFERYNPRSNRWQVLPHPPLHFPHWQGATLLDSATVVGRRVFIATLNVIFNLETQTWDPLPRPQTMAACFPYSPLFVQDTASLYDLIGPGSWKPGTNCARRGASQHLRVVKRGPISTTKNGHLLKSASSAKEQVMLEALDLDEDNFFAEFLYRPWRDLFYMGGRCFCYVVTAQLAPRDSSADPSIDREPKSRAVWIRFFEEVPAHAHNCTRDGCNCNHTKFRQLATFCYKIVTDFDNMSSFVRCSVLGTVPDSWIKSPQKFKQEWKPKQRTTRNRKTQDNDLMKLFLVQKEENSRLAAELARKDELLKTYEAMLANTRPMVRA